MRRIGKACEKAEQKGKVSLKNILRIMGRGRRSMRT
jgi:hypothetical protein